MTIFCSFINRWSRNTVGWVCKIAETYLESRKKGLEVYGDPHIKETDGFCASLPVVVKYAGQPGMLDMVS